MYMTIYIRRMKRLDENVEDDRTTEALPWMLFKQQLASNGLYVMTPFPCIDDVILLVYLKKKPYLKI